MVCWNEMLRRHRIPAKLRRPLHGSKIQTPALGRKPDNLHVFRAVTFQRETVIAFQEFGQPSDTKSCAEVRTVRHNSLSQNTGEFHDLQVSRAACNYVADRNLSSMRSCSVIFNQAFVVKVAIHRKQSSRLRSLSLTGSFGKTDAAPQTVQFIWNQELQLATKVPQLGFRSRRHRRPEYNLPSAVQNSAYSLSTLIGELG